MSAPKVIKFNEETGGGWWKVEELPIAETARKRLVSFAHAPGGLFRTQEQEHLDQGNCYRQTGPHTRRPAAPTRSPDAQPTGYKRSMQT
jgi:hypothetical protein